MKSSQIAIGILLALCAGCATKEMSSTPFYTGHEVKYTGRVEDRVNLWPAAYYRAPVGSIAWPLISFSDDHFAFRPLYSQYQKHGANVYNEFNVLWPIAQFDTYEELYRIFPFIWGDGNFCLFPEVWKGPGWWGVCPFFMANNADWVTLFPLFFGDFAGDNQYHTIFPLYYHSSKTSAEHETSYFWTALGLWGYKRRDGAFLNHRLLPLYYADQDDFWSIPYAHFDEGSTKKNMLLGGLAGLITKDDHYDASWFLPLFFHHEGDFGSLLWCHGLGSQGEMEFAMVPPLLTGWNTSKTGKVDSWVTLAGLAGATYDDENLHQQWLAPLYMYDKHDGFYSIPYSIDGLGHARTNHIFCAGLAKIYTGSQHGAHIPFLFDWKKDRGFDELLAIQDRDELPEDVTFKDVVVTNKKTKVVSTHRKGTYKGRASVSKGDKMSIFVSDNNKSVSAYMDKSYLWGTQDHSPKDDAWCLHSCGKRGNKLVFNTEWDRYTNFSAETRKKVKDEMKSSTSLFAGILFSHESEAKPFEKKVKSETRVLWRLWHREEKDGNVSVDMFPGFTYDAHQDGYRKSSFLWRFFRSEHDPKKGDSLDLLFLPIVRP